MKHVYRGALLINMRRIKACGLALSSVTDEYSSLYWQMELAKANYLKAKIQKRLKIDHNVIRVDFKARLGLC
jgi:hypothetical protein